MQKEDEKKEKQTKIDTKKNKIEINRLLNLGPS